MYVSETWVTKQLLPDLQAVCAVTLSGEKVVFIFLNMDYGCLRQRCGMKLSVACEDIVTGGNDRNMPHVLLLPFPCLYVIIQTIRHVSILRKSGNHGIPLKW